MNKIKTFAKNQYGRDFAVGDIHGHFSRLQAALDAAEFDPAVDRLFSVGDLTDRGPECADVLRWLHKPWFHAVQGNHEDFAIRHVRIGRLDTESWRSHGGGWFLDLPQARQEEIAAAFENLPVAIEVGTAGGIVGVVHADCPSASWLGLRSELMQPQRRSLLMSYVDRCMWSRDRISARDPIGVAAIRAVVVGHTPVDTPVVLGNVYHIDTGGWLPNGYFTLLELARLEPITARRGLDLSGLGTANGARS